MIVVAWIAWAIGLIWFVGRFVLATVSPCDAHFFDDSSPGVGTWQAFPPGLSCAYPNPDGPTVVISPGFGPLAVALLLFALPVYAVASHRLRHGVEFRGLCTGCGHDWREHPGGGFDYAGLDDYDPEICGECQYERSHGQSSEDSVLCRRVATPALIEPEL
jgi:hypothetical protein